MDNYLAGIFGDFGRIIIFLHVFSASLLIGGMFLLRFIIKPAMDASEDEAIRYKRCIKILDKFKYLVLILLLIILSASFFMKAGLGMEYASPITNSLIHIKESLWLFITFNFIYMQFKVSNAKKAYAERNFFLVHENMLLILNFLIPLNFILSIVCVYIGVIIRGY